METQTKKRAVISDVIQASASSANKKNGKKKKMEVNKLIKGILIFAVAVLIGLALLYVYIAANIRYI